MSMLCRSFIWRGANYSKDNAIKSLKGDIHFFGRNEYDEELKIDIESFTWGNNPRTATSSYTYKVIFFAQTEYLIHCGSSFDQTSFENWIRVVRNIVSRGDIDSDGKRPDIVRSPDTFVGAINLVHELSLGCSDIYKYLSTTPIKSTFAKEQIREEIVKANIIQEYPQYKDLLFKIEDNELLRGHITFALQCAGYNGNINSIDD